MATIGWIDFSNKDRKKAQQLMSLIRPEGQLDELGIGYIRDALANTLFPGISTIQTRAKYFFIIPYIFRDYQQLSPTEKRRTTAKQFLKQREHEVKNKLSRQKNYEEGHGIIGITLRDNQYIKRPASEIYWAGLQSYGFMNLQGHSRDRYLRQMNTLNPLEKVKTNEEEDDADSNHEEVDTIYTPVYKGWFENLQIDLTPQEKDFFSSQVMWASAQMPYSVLPQLIKKAELLDAFLAAKNFQEFVQLSRHLDYAPHIRSLLVLAHDFSILMEGLHLLYNHLLQQHIFSPDYDNTFKENWIEWRADLEKDMIDFAGFNTAALFNHTRRTRPNTELFINQWWQMVQQSGAGDEPSAEMQELIRQRERNTKAQKSRLGKPASANTDIELGKRIGLSLLQYRFYNARVIINDILTETNDAAS